jgi:hypothetical protein
MNLKLFSSSLKQIRFYSHDNLARIVVTNAVSSQLIES